MTLAALLLGVSAVSSHAQSDPDIVIERVVGPEVPGPYKHPATICQLEGGDLYIAYYGGEGEYEGDTAVYGLRKEKGAKNWSAFFFRHEAV